MIDTLMHSRYWIAAGWTMVHFLWVGTLIWLVAALGRALLRGAAPNARYLFTLGCLVAMAASPLVIAPLVVGPKLPDFADVTDASTSEVPPSIDAAPLRDGISNEATPASRTLVTVPIQPKRPSRWMSVVVSYLPWAWVLGTPVVFGLVAMGLVGADRLKRCTRLIEEGELGLCVRQLAVSLRITRQVAVGVCDRIASPIVVGILRPLILLPPSLISGCSIEQIEMILLHELAHVRRWDNLANLLQRIVEALLFFHPAVWWISQRVSAEREHCCDALVVSRTGRPRAYAQTLAALVHQQSAAPQIAAAMAQNNVVDRIRRILQKEEQTVKLSNKLLATLVALIFVLPALVLAGSAMQPAAAETTSPATEGLIIDTPRASSPATNDEKLEAPQHLLFASKRTGNAEIYLIDTQGNYLKNLTGDPAEDVAPDWSPDGSKIAFVSNRGGARNIYVMNADGSAIRRLTTDGPDHEPKWSPDGKRIVFRREFPETPRHRDIFVIDANGSNEVRLTNRTESDACPSWSPDGKKIVFNSINRDRGGRLHTMNADGSDLLLLCDKQTQWSFPSWSPDGKSIVFGTVTGVFVRDRGLNLLKINLSMHDVESGEDKPLTSSNGMNVYATWSPDSKRVIYQQYDYSKGIESGVVCLINADGSKKSEIMTSVSFMEHGDGRMSWKPN